MKIAFCSAALFSLWIIANVPGLADPAPAVTPKPHSLTQYSIVLTGKAAADSLQQQTDYMTSLADGKANLRAHNFVLAEEDFREAISVQEDGSGYLGLADALAGQNKTTEALQAYHSIFYPRVGQFQGGSYAPKANLECALLLNQNGRWAEAVDHYNAALPDLVKWDYKANLHFDPNAPQPAALAAAAHIGLGLYDNFEYEADSNTKALQEYNAALRLAPDWDAANYYYGYGWQHLSPAERTKFGTMQQAKAHLQKAEKVGNVSVRAAAAKVLKALG